MEGECASKPVKEGGEPQVGPCAKVFGAIGFAERHSEVNVKLGWSQRVDLRLPIRRVYRYLSVSIFQVDLEIPFYLRKQADPVFKRDIGDRIVEQSVIQ